MGKGIVKYNALNQNFTLFCSTSEPKGVSFTLLIFRWRVFDRRDVLYALENDEVENDQPPEAANVPLQSKEERVVTEPPSTDKSVYLLEHHKNANTDAIVDLITQEIEKDELQLTSPAGLASDGASVFSGSKNGVGVKLKKKQEEHIKEGGTSVMQQLWCICHRLALACSGANDCVKYIWALWKQICDSCGPCLKIRTKRQPCMPRHR